MLDKRIETEDCLPERQIWSYFIQLALGLQYLHHNHVLHRDLKPQNVLLAAGGRVKIADLGISQLLDHVFTRELLGSPPYIAPEMWQRQPYSYSADVWALGCILHEMCSLKPLFWDPAGDRAIQAKVLSGLLAPVPRHYSVDLWDVVRLMLTQTPADRPTIDEILALPVVQSRMGLLPAEDIPLLDPLRDDHASILGLVKISSRFDKWDKLNDLLPPSKYPDGPGVVEALRLRRPSSCPDLSKLDSAAPGASAGSTAAAAAEQQQQGQQRLGGRRRSLDGKDGSDQVPGMQHNCSCPLLDDGWELDKALRRKSITVGQLYYHRQQEAEAEGGPDPGIYPGMATAAQDLQATGPGAGGPSLEPAGVAAFGSSSGSSPGGTAHATSCDAASGAPGARDLKRTKSSGELLPSARAASLKAAQLQPWQATRPFDASPLQFGGGGRSSQHSAAKGGKPVRYLSSGGHAGTYAGSGCATSGSKVAPGGQHAATMIDLSMHGMHETVGANSRTLACQPGSSSGGGDAFGSPDCVLAVNGSGRLGAAGVTSGSTRGSPALESPGSPAAAATGVAGGAKQGAGSSKKEKKGARVKFMSRLRQRLWGDECDGGMHQPLW
ncbi:hypothetical protein N2152v2_005539 [Parachlorella kessleri]